MASLPSATRCNIAWAINWAGEAPAAQEATPAQLMGQAVVQRLEAGRLATDVHQATQAPQTGSVTEHHQMDGQSESGLEQPAVAPQPDQVITEDELNQVHSDAVELLNRGLIARQDTESVAAANLHAIGDDMRFAPGRAISTPR